jgi:hypothetical protein
VNTRVDYYSVSGVPDARIDGAVVENDCSAYDGAPACVNQTDIDNQYAVESPLLVEVTHSFSGDYTTIYVHVDITAGSDLSGDYALHAVVTERNLLWPTPPGSNGEMEFYNVMKKMLPDANGTDIASFTSGSTVSYDFEWTLDNIYIMNELQVIAFVQDNATKEILQTGRSEPNVEFPDFGITADEGGIECSETTTSPVVTLSNISDGVLSAIDITYSVDGGATNVYNWTGALMSGESTDITLPVIDFGSSGTHTLDFGLGLPDGVVDGNSFNNDASSVSLIFTAAYANIDEGFEDNNFPPSDWGLVNKDDGSGWSQVTNDGAYGESDNSAKADFYSIPSGIFDLYTSKMDLSSYTGAINLTFDRAYAKYNSTYVDHLRIYASTDCGETLDEIYEASSDDLSTAGNTTSSFNPDDDEWETDVIDISEYAGNDEVLFKFSAESGYGNNLFVDNIRISSPVAIENNGLAGGITVFPNPASAYTTVELSLLYSNTLTVNITDVTGKNVSALGTKNLNAGTHILPIQTANLADGIYFIHITGNGVNQVSKLNVSK